MSWLSARPSDWSPRDQNAALPERLAAYKAGSQLGVNISLLQPPQVRLLLESSAERAPAGPSASVERLGSPSPGRMFLIGISDFSFF